MEEEGRRGRVEGGKSIRVLSALKCHDLYRATRSDLVGYPRFGVSSQRHSALVSLTLSLPSSPFSVP